MTGDKWQGTSESTTVARPASLVTHLARIEVGPGELRKFLADGVADKIAGALKQIGYAHVTLDLQGYRRGSTNEVLSAGKANGDWS
jgi:PP-loop superfamily ATP-utilizing enzyme